MNASIFPGRCVVDVPFDRFDGLDTSICCRSSTRSLRCRTDQPRHSHDVAGGHRQFEVLINASYPAVDGLADAADGLAPSEVFFNALANRLADRVAAVPCRTAIDRAATRSRDVRGHMRRDATFSASSHEVAGVVSLIGRNGLGMRTRNHIEHRQRGPSLAMAIGMRDHRADHQAVRFSIST